MAGEIPRVTIVTPTKNRRILLEQAIASVRAQTFIEWQHLIVDDGSDDDTAEMVAKYAQADPRIVLVPRAGHRTGANVCRNQGIKAAQGEFIVFLDSDDLLSPRCLSQRVDIISRNADCDFVTFQSAPFVDQPEDLKRVFDADLIGDDLCRFLYFEAPWIISAPIWRKLSLEKLGLFDETLLSWQDIELHVRALTRSYKYLRFPEVDNHIRWQNDPNKVSIKQRRSEEYLDNADNVLLKLEKLVREGPGMNWVRKRAICSLYFFVAESWMRLGNPKKARAVWLRARVRDICPRALSVVGLVILLRLRLFLPLCARTRIIHKWKGLVRFRTIPDLVS